MISLTVNTLVLAPNHKSQKICSECHAHLELEEGVMFYDKKWFHNQCWMIFERKTGGRYS